MGEDQNEDDMLGAYPCPEGEEELVELLQVPEPNQEPQDSHHAKEDAKDAKVESKDKDAPMAAELSEPRKAGYGEPTYGNF